MNRAFEKEWQRDECQHLGGKRCDRCRHRETEDRVSQQVEWDDWLFLRARMKDETYA